MTPTASIEKPPLERDDKPTPRHRKLVGILFKYGGRGLIDRLKLGSFLAGNQEHMQASAGELAADLEALGPTYIKFGQLLSTRSDLLPDAVLVELERLQDQIQPMPYEYEMVKTIIEKIANRISLGLVLAALIRADRKTRNDVPPRS